MTSPLKPWETPKLQNNGTILRSSNPNPAIPQIGAPRSVPVLPPRPQQNTYSMNNFGYSGLGYGSYSSLPYRNSLYSPYGGYGAYNYGGYGTLSNYGARDNAEERFIQYAEERSRNTFSSIENIVRAFSSISMMLDNTFFAMTSSFRAVLSVAENFGRLRTVFGQIWYSVSIFRLFNWFYKKLRMMMGLKVSQSAKSLAWNEALSDISTEAVGSGGGSSWSALAFLGVILSAPYFISKLLPKYEDKCAPEKWKSSGIRAKAAFDFVGVTQNELTVATNDDVLLAPKYVQNEMKLSNTGWAYATCNGKVGVVPLNYLVVMKKINKCSNSELPIPRTLTPKSKKVSFGETQFFSEREEKMDSSDVEANDDVSSHTNVKDIAKPDDNEVVKVNLQSNEEIKVNPADSEV